jgi:hypothetical protein
MKGRQSPDPELLAAEEDDEDVIDETDSALRREIASTSLGPSH